MARLTESEAAETPVLLLLNDLYIVQYVSECQYPSSLALLLSLCQGDYQLQ